MSKLNFIKCPHLKLLDDTQHWDIFPMLHITIVGGVNHFGLEEF